jgi:hypothetical protein
MAFKGLGYNAAADAARRKETQLDVPGEILGIVDQTITDPQPQGTTTQWESDSGQVSMTEPPPPWELDEKSDLLQSDARRFVEVPKNWTLRWINPRLLDQFGWRDWRPVMASDQNVKVRVESMIAPEGNIRRGGFTGDILAWMYTSWVESRRRQLKALTDAQSDAAVRKQDNLREEFARGKFGPYIRLEEARHPSHTMAEGNSMRD